MRQLAKRRNDEYLDLAAMTVLLELRQPIKQGFKIDTTRCLEVTNAVQNMALDGSEGPARSSLLDLQCDDGVGRGQHDGPRKK